MLHVLLVAGCSLAGPRAEVPALHGICDASGAVRDGAALVVANDEDNVLRWFDTGGRVVRRLQLDANLPFPLQRDDGRVREMDLEGATRLGDSMFFIGSHGRRRARVGSDTPLRPNRRLLLDVHGDQVRAWDGLLAALDAYPPLADVVRQAEPLPPDAGGLNIEGLSVDPSTEPPSLVIGFRSPVDAGKRALVVRLDDPSGVMAGAPGRVSAHQWLDLGTRGVRSIEWHGASGAFVVLAGPVDHREVRDGALVQTPGYAGDALLFRWAGFGSEPIAAERIPDGFNIEAMVLDDGQATLISDDGAVAIAGQRCKDLWREHPERGTSRVIRTTLGTSTGRRD